MRRTLRLRTLGGIWTMTAFAIGLTAAALWLYSSLAWDRHLTRAYVTGFSVFEALRTSAPLPEGVSVTDLNADENQLANQGKIERLSGLPRPAFITNISILSDNSADLTSGGELIIALVSGDLRYPVADLGFASDQAAAVKLGKLTRLVASYCSNPVIFARLGDSSWQRIEGNAIWGCDAAPADRRLLAVISAFIAMAVLFTQVGNTAARFDTFAQALRVRRRFGGPESYETEGPEELREIVAAVNAYLEAEREQLAKRAIVLSGVSHDLGTPATRLRLRAELIPDPQLREKLEADIDQMTRMIEEVLTYTRSELSVEEPRQISLSSLVDALVADYQDMGKPVSLVQSGPVVVEAGRSVFLSRAGHGGLPEEQKVLVSARPTSLQRAITNLIDNALKYGRVARVGLEYDANTAAITIEDEGTEYRLEEIEALLSPFERGKNATATGGYGLGLTIVSTIAKQHGGSVEFETGRHGLVAKLTIQRN